MRHATLKEDLCWASGEVYVSTIHESVSPIIGMSKSIDPPASGGSFVEGKFQVNPVTISEVTGICSPTSYRTPNGTGCSPRGEGFMTGSGDLAAMFLQPPTILAADPQLQSLALSKAYGKLNDATLDVGMMLAELSETLGMLRSPLQGLRKYLDDVRKKIPRGKLGRSGRTDAIADTWLEWRYGITPFVSDIDAIRDYFRGQVAKKAATLRRKRGQKEKVLEPTKAWVQWGSYYANEVTSSRRKVVATIYFKIKPGFESRLMLQKFGFAPNQLPKLVWEKIPYSFIADWFFDFGNWISAMTPNPSIDVLGNCVSDKQTSIQKIQLSEYWWCPTFGPKVAISGSAKCSRNTLVRTVNQPIPAAPMLQKDIVKWKRVVDSISLMSKPIAKTLREGYSIKR